MTKTIGIIDYDAGNLLSIQRAIERFGVQTKIIQSPAEMELCDALILPGVGAFKDGMLGLERRGFIEPIKEYVSSGKPFCGICLGMQLLFDSSEEFGFCRGLGLIAGKVEKLSSITVDQLPNRIPHVGWSAVTIENSSLFNNLYPKMEYYFCHSYAVKTAKPEHSIAYYVHGGHEITAAVNHNNIYGFQFHPEKSGPGGLDLIKNILTEIKIVDVC